MTTTSIKRTSTSATVMSSNTIFLLVAIITAASAFNNKVPVTSTGSVTDRQSSLDHSTRMYGSRVRSLTPPSSFSRRRQQQTLTRTRLQFTDNASPTTAIESSWLRKLFTATSPSPNRSSTITGSSSDRSSASENEEQENVDAYLEFLDTRYRRLHCDDGKEETAQLKQQDCSVSKKGKPFSAMDWLTNGGSNNVDVVNSTREQQADALYVLGVAGLASQKLLQKHHLPTTPIPSRQSRMISPDTSSNEDSGPTMEKLVELKEQIDDAIEVKDTRSLKTEMNHFVVDNVLLHIIRVIYLAQRRKKLFLKVVQQQVTALATKATDGFMTALSQGPKSILNAVLTIGGGRQNILRTMTIGYASILVFRPLLRAVFAEGLSFDPLIQ